jgi:diguanylate cyclase (GGDEF)-like protein
VFAVAGLAAVLALGLTLSASYQREAERRGVAAGRDQAALLGQTLIEPLLDDRDLRSGLTPAERAAIGAATARARANDNIVRIRVRDLDGRVVFSDDGSGFSDEPDEEAVEVAHGEVIAELTHLNSDTNDTGPVGTHVVEVYRPLTAGPAHELVGVLEVYLPYDPISADIAAGTRTLYRDLVVGLVLLYGVLAFLCLASTRRLRQHAARNAYLAEHDQLTGLPNRRGFHHQIAALSAGRSEPHGAVAVIDLDQFKEVNDTLGHHNGDVLLVEIGKRLAAAVRPGDTVARLGGDEFGVVLTRVVDEEGAAAALQRLRAVIEKPVEVGGLPLTAEASIGFALAPEDGVEGDTLLQRADVAMYVAKASHAGVVRYDAGQDHYDAGKLALVGELRRALAGNELVLHYQPKARISDGEIVAVEALIRWEHPREGLLYPDQFLPLAEQTGLIDPLTTWVVSTALRQLRELGPAATHLSVAVNVSARNLAPADFADNVLAALRESGVAPERLILEITETAIITDPTRARTVLERLAVAGVRVSLDDFGQGQTSLGHLSQLPLAELKIDKSFVLDMLTEPGHASIVRAIIELAHGLGYTVVAEGVEDEQTLTALRSLHCDVAQGFLLTHALPYAELPAWLGTYAPRAAVSS